VEETILILNFKARSGFAPSYLAELLMNFTPACALRSLGSSKLAVPHFKLKT